MCRHDCNITGELLFTGDVTVMLPLRSYFDKLTKFSRIGDDSSS